MSASKKVDTGEFAHHEDLDATHEKAAHTTRMEKLDPHATNLAIVITPATNSRLFWKITRRILVIQVVTYFFQSLDKGILNYASIMGIKTDTHLVGQQYSWLGSILYFGILVGEYPQNFLLQKLPLAKMLAINVFIWGAIVACSAAATNFASLMVVRFLLGFFESCVQPAMMLLTSMWYRREEQSVLNSIWYCMYGVQLMVGGLLSFGVSKFQGGPIFNWQLLFLILGCATCVWSFFIGLFLPDSPYSAKCYTEEEKALMIERVRDNETGISNKEYKKYQVVEALTDPFVWCCVLMILVANFIIGGLGVFSNLIIEQFGFTLLQTQLLNIAQGAWTIGVMVGSAWTAQRIQKTCLVMLLWTIPAIAGTICILVVTPSSSNSGGMLIAFYCTQCFLAEGNLIISLVTRNIGGQTKKGITMTMIFVGWAVGNLVAPQVFQNSDAPRYLHGFLAHIVIYGVYGALVAGTWLLLLARNRLKTQAAPDLNHELAFDDLTDKENPNFRYVL
ncbi:putative MFS transporter [Aspergillus brunneoviolaceus CBS 621.78]|uniref:MFS general substrate transporter n=1 Tax=Aspergillus brunneoviolaceus CBS 621.78 TaxID=1450534 RepID=A0ACD1FVN3_9EURO|nr:MFS general substrate transporter [Aspergillus brunneoviolaceus CBS 621.78]RAH41027.1 MFS general substrate transporter [Aspergillus brunneoviolaceus CBS 621.78]